MTLLDALRVGAQPHEVAWAGLSLANLLAFELRRTWRWWQVTRIYKRQHRLTAPQQEELNVAWQRFSAYMCLTNVVLAFSITGIAVLLTPPPAATPNIVVSLVSATAFFMANLNILAFNITDEGLIARHRQLRRASRRAGGG